MVLDENIRKSARNIAAAAGIALAGTLSGDTREPLMGQEVPGQLLNDLEAINEYEIQKEVNKAIAWYRANRSRLPYLYKLEYEEHLPEILGNYARKRNLFKALGAARKFGIEVSDVLAPDNSTWFHWYSQPERNQELFKALDKSGRERLSRLKPNVSNFEQRYLGALAHPEFDEIVESARQRGVILDLKGVHFLVSLPEEQRQTVLEVGAKIGSEISVHDLFQGDVKKISERLALFDENILEAIRSIKTLPIRWQLFFYEGLDGKNFSRVIAALQKPDSIAAVKEIFSDKRLQETRVSSDSKYYDLLLRKLHLEPQALGNVRRMLTACPDDLLHRCLEALTSLSSVHVLDSKFVSFFEDKLSKRDAKATKHTFFGIVDSIAREYVQTETKHSLEEIIKSPELFLKLLSESNAPSALFEFLMVQDSNFFTVIASKLALNTPPEELLALTAMPNFNGYLMVRFFQYINPSDRRTRAFATVWYDGGILKGKQSVEHSLKGKAEKEYGSLKNLLMQDARIDWYAYQRMKDAFKALGLLEQFKSDIGGEQGLAELDKHFDDLK